MLVKLNIFNCKEFSKTITEYSQKYKAIAIEEAKSFLNLMKIHKELKMLTDSINPPSVEQQSVDDNPMADFTEQMHILATSCLPAHRR